MSETPSAEGLRAHREEFARRDLFLHALMGLASHGRALEGWLKAAREAPQITDELDDEGERIVDALLGAVAVHRALGRTFLCAPHPAPTPPAAEEPSPWTREQLR